MNITTSVALVVIAAVALGPPASGQDDSATMKRWEKAKPNWFEWVMPWGEALRRDTALNMSRLLDGPAGKHGFVRSVGNHFAFEDGSRARFWGACIGYQECMPNPKHVASMADWLAFNGFNCVREHFDQFIFSETYELTTPEGDHRAPNPVQLDRFDRLNAALRERGIYYHWVPFVASSLNQKDGALQGSRWGICFDEVSFRLQERFLELMLTHRNQYTGLRYADDPALAAIELANENAFSATVQDQQSLDPVLARQLTELWTGWLKERYGTDEALRAAWQDVRLGPGESLGTGTVRLPDREADKTPDSRRFAERAFSGWIELRYCRRLEASMRKLGLRVPVAPTNCQNGWFGLKAAAQTGFSGSHTYHSHPDTWDPATLGSWSHLGSSFAEHRCEKYMAASRTANVPAVTSEVNSSAPGDFRGEVVLSIAAHALLQDYDMVLWFTSFAYPQDYEDPGTRAVRDCFHFNFDPARIGLMPAASLMVQRRDVVRGQNVVEVLANDAVQRGLPKNWEYPGAYELPGLEWAAFLTRKQVNFTPERPTPGAVLVNPEPSLPVRAPGATVVGGPLEGMGERVAAELARRSKRFRLAGPGSGVSDTGELEYDQQAGVLSIDTPRTQAVIGNLASGARRLSAATIDFRNTAATVCVSALDDRPINASGRLLVSCVGDATNEGMDLRAPADTPNGGRPSRYLVQDWGWPAKRLLCEPVEGTLGVRLAAPARSARVYALDAAGRRRREVPCSLAGDTIAISPAAAHETIYYEVVIRR